jgi:tetratricopeptide (TPR) repeat protein
MFYFPPKMPTISSQASVGTRSSDDARLQRPTKKECANKQEIMSWEMSKKLVAQRVASNLNNNAARLFLKRQDADALMLYKESMSLLNQFFTQPSVTDAGAQIDLSGDSEHPVRISARDTGIYYSASEVGSFYVPLFLPLEEECPHNQEQPTSLQALCGDEFVEIIMLYNMGLLLHQNGRTRAALRFMTLAYNLADDEFLPHVLHPTFHMALAYHVADTTYCCGNADEALNLFIEAIEVGQRNLQDHILFASVCSRMGGLLLESRYLAEAEAVFQTAGKVYERATTGRTADINDNVAGAMPFAAAAA